MASVLVKDFEDKGKDLKSEDKNKDLWSEDKGHDKGLKSKDKEL